MNTENDWQVILVEFFAYMEIKTLLLTGLGWAQLVYNNIHIYLYTWDDHEIQQQIYHTTKAKNKLWMDKHTKDLEICRCRVIIMTRYMRWINILILLLLDVFTYELRRHELKLTFVNGFVYIFRRIFFRREQNCFLLVIENKRSRNSSV